MLSATSSIELDFFTKFLQSQHHFIWTLEGAVIYSSDPMVRDHKFVRKMIIPIVTLA